MRGRVVTVCALALLAGCFGGHGSAIDPVRDQKEAIQQQKDCADPKWKEEHLGVWYSICRPNAAVR
jgi:hypothetical protein